MLLSEQRPSGDPQVAVFTKNRLNPAYEAARIGAERAAGRLGARIEHYVPEIADDPDQQTALVAAALARRPDAFVFTAVHLTRMEPAIAAIRAAGIPIFSFIGRLGEGQAISHVGAADFDLASGIARRLFQHLGGRGRVVIVEGPPATATNVRRLRGFEAAALEYPGIDIVARCCGANLRSPGQEAFAEVLRSQPAIDGVLAANDDMAIGVLAALQAVGRQAAVVGVNAIPEAIQAIREGRMVATADFNAMQLCHLATECAIRHVRGQRVPVEIELPAAVVDRGNCSAWDRPYLEQRLLTLDEVGGRFPTAITWPEAPGR
ncbi:sugar ABC transporter substrate-binding protein [Ramlibacter sp. AN1015]|uniref:sugar ABC transporter substrate-binding protein n=1 Tax=Ramlibacter sp. AN1015 TaxID=3133428 RepID=UPI0030BEF6B5